MHGNQNLFRKLLKYRVYNLHLVQLTGWVQDNTEGPFILLIFTLICITWKSEIIVLGLECNRLTQIFMFLPSNDFLILEKLKKRPKIFKGQNKGQAWFFLDFCNLFSFLWSIGSKKPCAGVFFIFEAIKAKKAIQRPKHTILQKSGSNSLNLVSQCRNNHREP